MDIAREASIDSSKEQRQLHDDCRESCPFSSGRASLIAGSVGPYGACLHDGSEYTGSYVDALSVEQLKEWHR